jgi:Domain of unknown function (DUF3127)
MRSVGDIVTVKLNITSREYQGKHFNSISTFSVHLEEQVTPKVDVDNDLRF